MRLLDVYAGGFTPREALVYIDHLPPDSCFAEASAQDDEVAEMMAEAGEEPGKATPRVRDFGPTNQLLTGIYERLGEVIAATVAAAGGKPPRLEPLPRPETAADRLSRRVSEASADYILDQIAEARRRKASVDGGSLAD